MKRSCTRQQNELRAAYRLYQNEYATDLNPDLVVNDPQGKPTTVCFLNIQAMMLNELIKEQKSAATGDNCRSNRNQWKCSPGSAPRASLRKFRR
jgi:hypothetical protein